jgi:outer membrane biogenesis lipoprotein LolB
MRKRNILLYCSMVSLLLSACSGEGKMPPLSLRYTQPAGQWVEALPVGNGQLYG